MMKRPLKLPTRSPRERAESKALWNEARSVSQADFYTVGYEGRSTDDLLAALVNAEVRTLLDIRFTPLSMYRPELSKTNFQKRIESAGMIYLHSPDCGVPKDIRGKAMVTGTRDTIWEWYDLNVVNRFFDYNLHWFLNLEHPIAMMCVEHDPEECHRHRIFMALEKNGLRGFDL
jgi:uncharacterized protein (DUF488 family)